MREAARTYDWQIQDMTRRLRSCRDPRESASLHARITEARTRLDGTLAMLQKLADEAPRADYEAAPSFEVHLSYPARPGADSALREAVHVVLGDVDAVATASGVASPDVARVLDAVSALLAARLANVNAADTPPQKP